MVATITDGRRILMPDGLCKLCKETKELRDSHFLPKAMYKYLRGSANKNPNPVIVARTVTSATSTQVRDYAFCADCEDRLNKNGEKWVLGQVWNGTRFPLYERIQLAVHRHTLSESRTYSANDVGIDTDKLGYFLLSVLWRAAIHEWPAPFGGRTDLVNLRGTEEGIRQYLRGKSVFPQNVAIVCEVCTDELSQQTLLIPTEVPTPYGPAVEMLTLGLRAFMFCGHRISPEIRRICCINAPQHLLFLRDGRARILKYYAQIMRTSRESKSTSALYG
jgi:hypothetical protein